MSELNLSACPICTMPGSLARRTRALGAESYTWYECPTCGSVLLWLGNDRWAYQKIGITARSRLLQQPFTVEELRAMLETAEASSPSPVVAREPATRPAPPEPAPAVVEERATSPAARTASPEPPRGGLPLPEPARPQPAAAPAAGQRRTPALFLGIVVFLLCGMVAMAAVIGVKLLSDRGGAPEPAVSQAQATAPQELSTSLPGDTPRPIPTATWVPTLPPQPPPPTATLAPQVLAQLDSIEAEMARQRELAQMPVNRSFMSRRNLVAHTQALFDEAYLPSAIEAEAQVLRLFGFLPENFDLRDWREAFYTSQTAGFYDEKEKTLYIVTDGLGESLDPLVQFTFSHEYAHALEDQHFDLGRVLDRPNRNDDEVKARLALIEGSASVASVMYLASLYGAEDGAWESVDITPDLLASGPSEIASNALFPYTEGYAFVSMLVSQGGWEAVNRAFADPPQSSEQILHPDRYLTRDEPALVALQPLTETLGSGWHLVAANALGQHELSLYLSLELDQESAIAASQGWDGDCYALYTDGDDQVLVAATVWDSVADREEFVAAYTRFAQARHEGLTGQAGDAEIRWETPGAATLLAWRETRALFVVASNGELAEQALAVSRP